MAKHRLDSEEWDGLVARLGGADALAESARQHRAFVRPREVKSATDLLRLALMYGPGGRSLRMLAAEAAADGVAEITNVAMLNRLRGAADWLEALCAEQLGARSQAAGLLDGNRERDPVLLAERPIRLVDSSQLGADFRLHLAYDPVAGRIAAAGITSSAHGDKLDRLPIMPGEIRIGDRGFPKPEGLRDTLACGADVVVRLTWNSLGLRDATGTPLDWLALFAAAKRNGAIDLGVEVTRSKVTRSKVTRSKVTKLESTTSKSTREPFEPIALRLVIIPKPAGAIARASAAARETNRKKGRKSIDPRTLAGVEHMVLLTSLTADFMPVDRLAELYRTRWQIELAFKRLKSVLNWDHRPAKDERLARAWLHAHFLFALLIDDIQDDYRDDLPDAVESGALPP